MPDETLSGLVREDKNSNLIKKSQAIEKSTWYDWYCKPSKAGKFSEWSKVGRFW